MTLALYGKSRKRQGGLIFSAFMAAMVAAIAAVATIGVAFAHHTAYDPARACNGSWSANGDYVGGSDRKLVLVQDVVVNGVAYAASWSNSAADPPPNDSGDGGNPVGTNQVILRSAYAGSTAGLPADAGATDFLWVGADAGFDVFTRSGGAGTFVSGAANWSGTIRLYHWTGSAWTSDDSDAITQPTLDEACIHIKKVVTGAGSSAADVFTADVNNSGSTSGDSGANDPTFSQNSPANYSWDEGDDDNDDFVVTEVGLPANYAVTGKWVTTGDADCANATWSASSPGTASGGALDNLENGDEVTVCFRNAFTVPTPAKVKATGADSNKLYWEISVANLAIDQTVAIVDSGATYESVSGGTCSDTTFDPYIVCKETALAGPLTVKVSKAKPAATCEPQYVNNSATVYNGASNTAPSLGTVGGTDDTKYTIAGNPALCGGVTWDKSSVSLNPSVGDVHLSWYIDVTNTSASPGSVTIYDPGTSLESESCSNTVIESPADTYYCEVPAATPPGSYGVQLILRGPKIEGYNPKCDDLNASNTASTAGNFNSSDTLEYHATATGTGKDCLTVTKDKSQTSEPPTWNITITNSSDSAQDVWVVDSGATYNGAAGGGSCSNVVAGTTSMTNGIKCTINANSQLVISVTKAKPAAQCGPTEVDNEVKVWVGTFEATPSAQGPDFTDNTGNKFTYPGVAAPNCITVQKVYTGGGVWTITFTNTGPQANINYSDTYQPVATGSTITAHAATGCEVDGALNLQGCNVTVLAGTPGTPVDTTTTVTTSAFQCGIVTNTVSAYFGTSGGPLIGTDFDTHEETNCSKIIRLCKVWSFNDPAEISDGSTGFVFDVNGSGFPINGVTEGNLTPTCILLDVALGPVTISETLTAGFHASDVTVVPGGGTSSNNNQTVDFILTKEGCFNDQESLVAEGADLVREVLAVVAGPQLVTEGDPVCTITFFNYDDQNEHPSGNLRVEKYLDINGDGDANDPGEGPIANWNMTVSGDDVNGVFPTSSVAGPNYGTVDFNGLETNDIYHVTEANVAGFTVTNATVNGVSIGASTFAATSIPNGGTTAIQFYNKPAGGIIIAHKVAYTTSGNLDTLAPNDDDGWTITVTSAQCGINQSKPTDANGNATFTNLPLCTDYVVSENPVNASSPGFVPSSPTSVGGQTPNGQTITFVNKKPVFDPPCSSGCTQQTPTVTPPTSTPVPPTATPTTPPTQGGNPPVTQIAGEKTPGASPTPIAPSTGGGLMGGAAGGMNLVLILGGLLAITSGLSFVALGRKNRR